MRPQNSDPNAFDDGGLDSDESPFGTLSPSPTGDRSSQSFRVKRERGTSSRAVQSPGWVLFYFVLMATVIGGTVYFTVKDDAHRSGIKHYNAGLKAEKAGDKPGAIVEYSKAIQFENNLSYKADAYIQRGVMYKQSDQDDKALADFNQAIAIDPKKDAPYYDRGQIYSKRGKYAQALQDFDKSAELNPTDNDVYGERTLVFILDKKTDSAVSQAKQLMARGGKLRTWSQEALVKMLLEQAPKELKAGQSTAALQDASDAIFFSPDQVDAYRQRAAIYVKLNDGAHARADVAKIQELGGNPPLPPAPPPP